MPKLSIIIPIYNVEAYLPACLDSVSYPQLPDYEVVCVNDGSTDRSAEIAAEYARKDAAHFRLISQENKGLGGARNAGIEAAQGGYLMFLDSDDTLAPHAVEEMLHALEADVDVLFFDCDSVSEDGRVLASQVGCGRDGVFSLADYPQLIFEMPSACNKLWRRSLFTDTGVRFPERLWFEDLATSPRLYLHAERMTALHRPWLRYLQRSGSITNSKNARRNLEIIRAVDLTLAHYRQQGQWESYHNELEYLALYHQLLMTSSRVDQIDPGSGIPAQLLADLEQKFPDFRQNPYREQLPAKYKLLLSLILHGRHRAVAALMKANNRLRRKEL